MRQIIAPFLILASTSGILLGLTLLWQPLGLVSLPLTWVSPFVLGDEATERYGVSGELIRVWYCSLPLALAYATVWAASQRVKHASARRSSDSGCVID